MNITKYPDGTSYASGVGMGVHGSVFRINTYEDLWHLNQVVDAYNHKFSRHKPTITIPNLIDAQADKRFGTDQSSGLKLVCKFLNCMKANFKIFHPHNPEVVEALIDNVEIIDNSEFILRVLNLLNANPTANNNKNIENLILMSSDAGGFKPLMKLCDTIEWEGQVHSCSKGRAYNNGVTELTQRIGKDDFFGKDILIVDDISIYGGTFKGLSKLLKQRNCGKLYLAVSHMTVRYLGEDPVTNYFNKVFSTNSKWDKYDYQPENLEIIKIF